MRAHLVVEPIVAALVEQVEVVFSEKLWSGKSGSLGHVAESVP